MFNARYNLLAITLLLGCQAASAADLEIGVTAVYSKLGFFPASFGSTDAELLVDVSAVVDDSLIETYPAGTEYDTGLNFANEMTVIPLDAIQSFTATLGTGTWDISDLQVINLPSLGVDAAILVEGDISNSSASLVAALSAFDSNVGELNLSGFTCPTSACSLRTLGYASDYLDGSSGNISDITASVAAGEAPVEEQIEDLADSLESSGAANGTSNALRSFLDSGNTDNDKRIQVILSVNRKSIEKQVRKGELDQATADELIADIDGILESL